MTPPEDGHTATRALPRELGRVPAFDGVRGVAVLLVVWSHIGLIHVIGWKPLGGFLGVDAFFVLSGFLITALLLREQAKHERVRFGAFYRRRALRLLPVVVAFVIAHYVFANALNLSMTRERSSVTALVFYYTNWRAIYAPPLALAFGHLWSLAVEEQFYLVWPIIVVALGIRARLRTVVLVLGTMIAIIAVHRAVLWQQGAAWDRLFVGTDTRADTILIGALLAHLWVRDRTPRRAVSMAAWVSVIFFGVCVLLCGPTGGFLYLGGFTAIAVAVAVMLLAILDTNWSGTRLLQLRPIRAVGRVSYGLYVWHPLVFVWVWWYTRHWNRFARLSAVAVATTLVTYGSWKLVEHPFLRWKDRIERRSGRAHDPTDSEPAGSPVPQRLER